MKYPFHFISDGYLIVPCHSYNDCLESLFPLLQGKMIGRLEGKIIIPSNHIHPHSYFKFYATKIVNGIHKFYPPSLISQIA